MKDAARFFARYVEALRGLDYDPRRLSLGLLEGDSTDATWSLVEAARADLARHFARVTTVKRDFGYRPAAVMRC